MQLTLDAEELKPLVAAVAAELLESIPLDDRRDAYSEAEAAARLGVKPHVLRVARLRGEVSASQVGGSFRYTRSQLLTYLAQTESTK